MPVHRYFINEGTRLIAYVNADKNLFVEMEQQEDLDSLFIVLTIDEAKIFLEELTTCVKEMEENG